jgi:hypothetical protein
VNRSSGAVASHSNESAQHRHVKEQILCLADDHQKNRQHVSVFVRNCRLVMLLRREAATDSAVRQTIFRPAEWRWRLPQVCDGRWHQYALNVHADSNSPTVELWVDGQSWTDHNSPDIDLEHVHLTEPDVVDDWPLHRLPGVNTTLTVGACWAGALGLYRQPLHGALAGLAVLSGYHEPSSMLRCLHKCRERLVAPNDLNDLRSIAGSVAVPAVVAAESEPTSATATKSDGESTAEHVQRLMRRLQKQQNSDQDEPIQLWQSTDGSKVRIFAANALEIEDALSQVAYENDRTYATAGRRNVRIDSQLTCADGRHVRLSSSKLSVLVEPTNAPQIRLNGTNNLAREYEAFSVGVRLFASLQITVNGEPTTDASGSLKSLLGSAGLVGSSLLPESKTTDSGKTPIEDSSEQWNSPPEVDVDEPLIDSDRVPVRDRPEESEDLKAALEAADWTNLPKLDSCQLQVYPPLNPEHEHVALPEQLMRRLGVRSVQTVDALRLFGVHAAFAYERLLRRISYVNRKPAYYLSRAFKLTCADLNGRFVSNEYVQTLTVIHPKANVSSTESNVSKAEISSATAAPASSTSSTSPDHEPEVVDPIPQVQHVIGSDSVNMASHMLAHPQHVPIRGPQIKPQSGLIESTLIEDGFARTSASKRLFTLL